MAKETLVIIDYGSGNLRSAAKAFEHVARTEGFDLEIRVSGEAEDLLSAARIVLPGQGAFGDCMRGLRARAGMEEALRERVVQGGVPFLGICVGMQLMADRGLEHGVHEGLGWIPGEVVPLAPSDHALKIPHMGWNAVRTAEADFHVVLRSVKSSSSSADHFYFVHSFMVQCKYRDHVLAETDYGGDFPSVIGRDNMIGVQFHPEKSQQAGLALLADFVRWRP